MKEKYIVDTNVLSYTTWANVLNVDKVKQKLIITCNRTFGNRYRCQLKDDSGKTYDEIDLFESEVNTLMHTADTFKKVNDYVEMVFVDKLRKLKEAKTLLDTYCKSKNCYTLPELPYVDYNGNMRNIFVMSINKKLISPSRNSLFNEKLKEIFNKYDLKVLIDNDFLQSVSDPIKKTIENNVSLFVGSKHLYKDINNEFYKIIKVSDGKNTIVYDTKHNILYINNKPINIDEKTLNENPALRNIVNVLKEGVVDVNLLHEAIKTLDKAEVKDGKITRIRTFYPSKAEIDTYLITVAHGHIKVITADKGIREGFESIVKPLDPNKIIFV